MSDTQQNPVTPDPTGPAWAPGPEPNRRRRRVGTVALVAGGLLAGGILGGTLSATASGGAASATAAVGESGSVATDGSTAPTPPSGTCDEAQGPRSGETALEGDVAEKVEAAALAEYPRATVLRVETDSDGVYEAHLVTADGEHVAVAVGEDFTVTGVEEGGAGPGAMGGRPGRGPGGPMGQADDQTAPDGFSSPDSSDDASQSALTS